MQRMRAFAAWLAVAIVVVSVVKPPFEHWVSLGTLALVARGVWVTVSQIYRHRSRPVPDKGLIVGEADEVSGAVHLFSSYAQLNVLPVATATPDGLEPTRLPGGAMTDLLALIEEHDITHVISVSSTVAPKLEHVLARSRPYGVRLSALQPLGELLTGTAEVVNVRGLPFLPLAPRREAAGPAWVAKRAIDYAFGSIAMVALSPVFALAALAVKLDSRGPIFFRQERVGRDGVPFTLWKFRSMVDGAEHMLPELAHLNEADGAYFKIQDDPRVTRVGRVLRRFSIDELPQLFNVLRGEMSLVGPRPFLKTEMDSDPEAFEWRVHFMPGITGLWQIAGRSWLPRLEGLRMDLAYIENWSVPLDLRIMFRTIVVALQNERRPSYEHLHAIPAPVTRYERARSAWTLLRRIKPSVIDPS
jgi:exopolysaccharide biosynthesis polyprenyl glycosylphosphotransferase